MFDEKHYVPILKGRAAEFAALGEVGDRESMTPLIELAPIAWDFVEGRPNLGVDEHVHNAIKRLQGSWGGSGPALLDLIWLDPNARCAEGEHPLAFALREAQALGLDLVPVLALDRDDAFRAAVGQAQSRGSQGAALRLYSSDLLRPSAPEEIDRLLGQVGLTRREVDLVVDLRTLNTKENDFNVMGALGVLGAVPHSAEWRTLTLAGGSFPPTLSDMKPASVARYPRAEWSVWQAIRSRGPARMPTFADYGIGSPDPPPVVDPRLMRVSAQLRYTDDDHWLVFKERNIRDYGNGQFLSICTRLVERPEFSGRDFSWGDRYIAERADGTQTRPGNPQTWRKVGTSHHLAKVVSQIASLDT